MREEAGKAIVKISGERAIASLSPVAAGKNWLACKEAAELLGELGGVGAIPPLMRLLEHEQISVRRSAVKALGRVGDEAEDLLQFALHDNASSVRDAATVALMRCSPASKQKAGQF